MSIPRATCRFIARLMMGVLLFAQLAFAAHACGGMASTALGGADAPTSGATMAGMAAELSGQDASDAMQPNLCAAHCQSGQQNAGAKALPDLPATLPARPSALAPEAVPNRIRLAAAVQSVPPSADPPHAILHCCLRI